MSQPTPLSGNRNFRLLWCANALSAAETRVIPDALQGRVQSTSALLPALVSPLGPLAAGILTDRVPSPVTLLVFGTMLLAPASFSSAGRGLHHIPGLRHRGSAPVSSTHA